jgi:hypothetical protein
VQIGSQGHCDTDQVFSQSIAQFIKDIALKYTGLNTTLGILGNADSLDTKCI